jgi:MoaE-MoaD fusion protein
VPEKTIQVKLLFFGAAKEVIGSNELELQLPEAATTTLLLNHLTKLYPALSRFGSSLLVAVNQEYVKTDLKIENGDEIAIFPPVSGGEKDLFQIVTEKIDLAAVVARISAPECGATVVLDGYVRNNSQGRRTLYLVYEAYTPMAITEMRRLGSEALEKFSIKSISIVHRVGRLEIGETSVVIAVSAPHRREAFAACEWAIKELKRTVPIWKKEFFEDGEVWVEGESI